MLQQSRARKLGTTKLSPADYRRTVYTATPDLDVSFDEILMPEFWGNVAQTLRPGDFIEIFSDDSSYFAELLVVDCGQRWAKVAVLQYKELAPHTPEALHPEYDIRWGGNTARFKVVRLSDKETLKDNFAAKLDAEIWLKDYHKALAA